jgi:hypothetical protein
MPIDIPGTATYTNGVYQKPASKDTGDIWTDVIESFIERIATHSHSGADSKKISLNIAKLPQDITAGIDFTWNNLGNDVYEASIDLLAPATYDLNIRKYYYLDGADYVEFYPTVEKVDSDTILLRSNKNGFDLRIIHV